MRPKGAAAHITTGSGADAREKGEKMAAQQSGMHAKEAPPAVEARGLTKRYEEVEALRDLNLSIARRTIYALLGPNGAGKTTTVSLLTTLIRPTSGSARVAGFDVVREAQEVRRRIGVTFQEVVLDEDLSGRTVLDIHGRLYGMGRGGHGRRGSMPWSSWWGWRMPWTASSAPTPVA